MLNDVVILYLLTVIKVGMIPKILLVLKLLVFRQNSKKDCNNWWWKLIIGTSRLNIESLDYIGKRKN